MNKAIMLKVGYTAGIMETIMLITCPEQHSATMFGVVTDCIEQVLYGSIAANTDACNVSMVGSNDILKIALPSSETIYINIKNVTSIHVVLDDVRENAPFSQAARVSTPHSLRR